MWSITHLCPLSDEVNRLWSSLSLLGLLNRLEEPLQVLRLLLQEFDFFLASFGIVLALLIDDGLYRLNLGLLLKNAFLLLLLAFL